MNLVDVGPLNDLVKTFEHASGVWAEYFQPRGIQLFGLLAAIEMTWFSIAFMLTAEPSLDKFLRVLLRKLFPLGMSLWLITFGPHYLAIVAQGFGQLGQEATAWSFLQGFHPSSFLNLGVQSMSAMANTFTALGYLALGGGANYVLALLSLGTLIVCFVAMTALLVTTLAEAWFVLGIVPFLVAFGATRWTYTIAEAVLTHMIRVSIKLFVLYMYGALIAAFAADGLSAIMSGKLLDLRQALLYAASVAVATVMMFSVGRITSHLVPAHINWGLNPQTETH